MYFFSFSESGSRLALQRWKLHEQFRLPQQHLQSGLWPRLLSLRQQGLTAGQSEPVSATAAPPHGRQWRAQAAGSGTKIEGGTEPRELCIMLSCDQEYFRRFPEP